MLITTLRNTVVNWFLVFEDEGTSHSTPKCAKLENDTAITKVGEQIQLDEQLARKIESELNKEFLQDHQICDNLTIQIGRKQERYRTLQNN